MVALSDRSRDQIYYMYDTRNTHVTHPRPQPLLAHGCLSKCKSEPRYCRRLCVAPLQLLGNSSRRQYCTGGTTKPKEVVATARLCFCYLFIYFIQRG